jgi:hypothetical protein
MSTIVLNECGVVTILPMGVECNVSNASTNTSKDGAIYLTITGGSVPYDISWSNGAKSQNIYNLTASAYTATIVDYYGDYSATTTCVVESDSFDLDYFANCYSGELKYFTGLTQNQLLLGGVYKFETTTGCWTYSGKTTYSGQSYTGDVLSVYYETCEDCDPPITYPYYPEQLCLYSTSGSFIAYPFEFYDFVNDKPAYTGTGVNSSGYTIQWSEGFLNQWILLGKTGNILSNTNDTFNPLGSWVLQGTQQTYTAVSGSCPSTPALSMVVSKQDETCDGECDGSIIISTNGGTGGYTYSIDGSTYQIFPTFTDLCDQTLTVYCKDSSGDTITQNVTIGAGPKKTTYKISIDTKQVDTQLNYGTQVNSRLDYVVNVTPSLPDGVEINVPLLIGVQESTSTPGQTTVTYTPSLYSGGTLVTGLTALTNTLVVVPNPYTYLYPYLTTNKTYSVKYDSLVLKKGLVISGSVTTSITKVSSGSQTGCNAKEVYNAANTTKYYSWVNCTGGTESNYLLFAGQTAQICARSVSPNSSSNVSYPGDGIIVSDGTLSCGSAVTNGNITVTAGFNGPSISNGCSLLQVLTPPSSQLKSQLYQP